MSSTPRTDRAEDLREKEADKYDYRDGLQLFAADGWEFARKLERENQRLKKDRDYWMGREGEQ